MEGTGEADRTREIAQGQADAAEMTAGGEAAAIKLVAQAAKEAASNPVFLKLRMLEIEGSRIDKWDGKYPTYYMGSMGTNGPNLLLSVPTPPVSK